MSDKKIIILDENVDENVSMSVEEIEEAARKERLGKISKPGFSFNVPYVLVISRITNIIGLFGIMFSMLTVNGTALVVSLLILLVSTIVNYLFFK